MASSISRSEPTDRRFSAGGGAQTWLPIGAVVVAVSVGGVVGSGRPEMAVVGVGALAFSLIAAAAPERTFLALIVALPFMIAPLTFGDFSLFIALPLFLISGLAIILTSSKRRDFRTGLPVVAFSLFFAISVVSTLFSADVARGGSRLVYLALFGLVALASARAIASERISTEAIARAVVLSGTIAAIAVIVQFVAQFVVGKEAVLSWLFDVEAIFAGERAASGIDRSNWVTSGLDLVRGIVPFMSPPSSGQYLMMALLPAVWLKRVPTPTRPSLAGFDTLCVIVIALGLMSTFSRQAWIGAVVGLLALLFLKRNAMSIAVVTLAATAAVLVPIPGAGSSFGDYLFSVSDTSTASSASRIVLLEDGIELIPENALLGVGPGQIASLRPDPTNPDFYAHNVLVDAVLEVGVPGALCLLAILLIGLMGGYRQGSSLAAAMILSWVVAGLFDDVFYFPRNGILLAIAFGLLAAGALESARQRENDVEHAAVPMLAPSKTLEREAGT